MNQISIEPSSFKDPDGCVFYYQNEVYRSLNPAKVEFYKSFLNDSLFEETKQYFVRSWLVESPVKNGTMSQQIVLKHEKINCLVYPYEWPSLQLRETGIRCLKLQLALLEKNLTLKDGHSFNWNDIEGCPINMDLLSLTEYPGTGIWVGFNEFLQYFYYPLLIYSKTGLNLPCILRGNMGKIDLDLAMRLLSKYSIFSRGILKYIKIPSYTRNLSNKYGELKGPKVQKEIVIESIKNLLNDFISLPSLVKQGHWINYVNDNTYDNEDRNLKHNFIDQVIKKFQGKKDRLLDLGANTGEYCLPLVDKFKSIVAIEADLSCANRLYQRSKKVSVLVMDLTNPTPGLGWGLTERKSFFDRFGHSDLVLALGLIHHLRFTGNIPLIKVIELLHQLGKSIIVEWISRDDPMVKSLTQRKRIEEYVDYEYGHFVKLFESKFILCKKTKLKNNRELFWGKART